MAQSPAQYPAQLSVDYPDRQLDRFSSFFRILFMIPIWIVSASLIGGGFGFGSTLTSITAFAGGVLFIAPLLMILFRQKYPRWWYDWNLNLTRFTYRITVYSLLMRDEYPATDDDQSVHLDFPYPNVETDLNGGYRW